MNYKVRNNITEDERTFTSGDLAMDYLFSEIKRLNDEEMHDSPFWELGYESPIWSSDDFALYKFDAKVWKWVEVQEHEEVI